MQAKIIKKNYCAVVEQKTSSRLVEQALRDIYVSDIINVPNISKF